MPFTLAHPAILFPLMKKSKYFSATALIIGSMVPDIEFIAQMQVGTNCAHHFPGIFLINIPLGLVLCYIYHALIKDELIKNLPNWLQSRLQFSLKINWIQYAKNNKLVVISSLALGIISHMALDAFTHDIGIFVKLMPILKSNIFFLNEEMPIYHLLQIISSAFGLLGLVYFVWKLPKTNRVNTSLELRYWLNLIVIIALLSIIRFQFLSMNNGFWDVVLAIMGIGMYGMILNSLFHTLWRHSVEKVEALLFSRKSQV